MCMAQVHKAVAAFPEWAHKVCRKRERERDYRLGHEGNLHVLLQPLASACINHPVEGARIPVRARYQKTPLKVSSKTHL